MNTHSMRLDSELWLTTVCEYSQSQLWLTIVYKYSQSDLWLMRDLPLIWRRPLWCLIVMKVSLWCQTSPEPNIYIVFVTGAASELRLMFRVGKTSLKKVREKSRECHNHKQKPFQDSKRKGKPTSLNKQKPNKRTKSSKISSLFPKQSYRNTKRLKNTRTKWHTERHTTNRLVE